MKIGERRARLPYRNNTCINDDDMLMRASQEYEKYIGESDDIHVSWLGKSSISELHLLYSSRATFLTWRRGVYEISERRSVLRCDRPTSGNDRRPHIWENFKWPYLREGSSGPLHVWFYGGVFRGRRIE